MKRAILFTLLLLSLHLLPVAAQEASLVDWIPADFDGFLRVDMKNAPETLQRLNFSVFIATIFQPTRLTIDSALSFDSFFPLSMLDVENLSFNSAVLPWLKDELIVAYRTLPSDYQVAEEDVLLILPTEDPFNATSGLSAVIRQQDLLERASYRDVTIYNGDRTSLAITPLAVLIGSEEVIQQALDTAAGEGDALVADSTYQGVSAALRDDLPVFAYFCSEAAANGLAFILSGSGEASPLLASVGEALSQLTETQTVESALLSGEIDGLGVTLQPGNAFSTMISATAVFHTSESDLLETETAFDPAVLDYVPRSALLVQSGSNAQQAVLTSLAALPLGAVAGRVLGGFPVLDTSSPQIPTPTAEDVAAAVSGFTTALDNASDINLLEDVVGSLEGSYSFALLPRPNNPLPLLETPFDALFVAQVSDGEALLDDLTSLLGAFVGEDNVDVQTADERTVTVVRVPQTGEAILELTLLDDALIIGTGDATETALNAQRGDNRLINQPRWQAMAADVTPNFYLDVAAYYSTFFPAAASRAGAALRQVGIYSRALGDGLYEVQLVGTVPASQ